MAKPIHQHLAETLVHVAPKIPRSTGDIFKRLNNPHIQQTAVSNRLNDLQKLGLVAFERRGKDKFWKRVK